MLGPVDQHRLKALQQQLQGSNSGVEGSNSKQCIGKASDTTPE
jgi:hypothetical protein